jgi:hypothetical protein
MSRKSDNVVIRLRKLIEEEKLRKSSDFLAEFFPAPVLDPVLQRARDLAAAVQLRPNEVALKTAFKSFDLDPSVAAHWHLLVNYLARSHFETKRAGAKRTWTAEKYLQLLQDARVAAKKTGVKDVQAWVRYMRKDPSFEDRYKRLKPESLRRKIYQLFSLVNAASGR